MLYFFIILILGLAGYYLCLRIYWFFENKFFWKRWTKEISLGYFYYEKDDFENAIIHFKAAYDLLSNNYRAYTTNFLTNTIYYGESLYNLNRIKEAKTIVETGIGMFDKRDNENKEQLHRLEFLSARILMFEKRYDEANLKFRFLLSEGTELNKEIKEALINFTSNLGDKTSFNEISKSNSELNKSSQYILALINLLLDSGDVVSASKEITLAKNYYKWEFDKNEYCFYNILRLRAALGQKKYEEAENIINDLDNKLFQKDYKNFYEYDYLHVKLQYLIATNQTTMAKRLYEKQNEFTLVNYGENSLYNISLVMLNLKLEFQTDPSTAEKKIGWAIQKLKNFLCEKRSSLSTEKFFLLRKQIIVAESFILTRASENLNYETIKLFFNYSQFRKHITDEKFVSPYIDYYEQFIKTVKADVCIIDILRFPNYDTLFTEDQNFIYCYTTVTSDSYDIVIHSKGKELEQLYDYYIIRLTKKEKDFYSYKNFFGHIEKYIFERTKLYISPDGIYQRLNLLTLIDNNGNYLLNKYKIRYFSKFVKNDKPHQKNNRVASLFGNPAYDHSIPNKELFKDQIDSRLTNLPLTEEEVKGIEILLNENSYKVNSFIQEEATSHKYLNLENSEIIHFATHSFYRKVNYIEEGENAAWFNTGLFLANSLTLSEDKKTVLYNSDECLTAWEIATKELPNTNLVVLNVCNSNDGLYLNIGEQIGVVTSFMIAGAKNVMATQWDLYDYYSKEFIKMFYEKYMRCGILWKSLNIAQKQFSQMHQHPFYWGAYILLENNFTE